MFISFKVISEKSSILQAMIAHIGFMRIGRTFETSTLDANMLIWSVRSFSLTGEDGR